jgi:hypothetical protein
MNTTRLFQNCSRVRRAPLSVLLLGALGMSLAACSSTPKRDVASAVNEPATAGTQPTGTDYAEIAKVGTLAGSFEVKPDGKVQADPNQWTRQKEDDGTELYTTVKNSDVRVAVLKNPTGGVDSFTTFKLHEEVKGVAPRPETDESMIFKNGKLSSRTSCEEAGGKDSFGRICTTATPALCRGIKAKGFISSEALEELDQAEMRSLALILTLRGTDHQLDNVVRFGNRLGLTRAVQTTKGQLILVSREPQGNLPLSARRTDEQREAASAAKALEKLKNLCGTFLTL